MKVMTVEQTRDVNGGGWFSKKKVERRTRDAYKQYASSMIAAGQSNLTGSKSHTPALQAEAKADAVCHVAADATNLAPHLKYTKDTVYNTCVAGAGSSATSLHKSIDYIEQYID